MSSLLTATGLAIAGTAGIWIGSVLLERSSEELSAYYGLPPIVKGAIVVAIGSSFPELASVVIATVRYGVFDLGVGAIVGSAIFNILVIPALAALFSKDELSASRALVYKEAQFYMLAVSVLIITFSLAVIYNPVPGEAIRGSITRPLALIPIGLYVLYVFIQYQDVSDHNVRPDTDVDLLRQWGTLALSLLIILIAVEGVVDAAVTFGDVFGTPEFLWGLTVVAAATSLPDAFVSIRAARGGASVTSLANVMGSNTFDLLVAVPTGVLIAGATTVNFSSAVPMLGVLTFATVLLFTALRTDLEVTDREAVVLLGAYVLFLLWLVAETLGFLNLLPGT